MKEDHMLNGQLKPAYNVQIAVENYFIVHGYVSNDRTDYNTLIPVLEKHRKAFGDTLEAVTDDSGYCSEKNLLYLKENKIRSFIKLQDHEKRKTRAYREDIGKYYNMRYAVFEDEHYYICHDGRQLRHIRTESKEMDGYCLLYTSPAPASAHSRIHLRLRRRCRLPLEGSPILSLSPRPKVNKGAIGK